MVKKYAVTIQEDVMSAHNKTLAQLQELLTVLTHYGKVADYEADRKVENAEYQATIDGLKAQLEAIKDQKLTPDEIELIKAYRVQMAKHDAEKDKVVAELTKQLETVVTECEQRITRVRQALG